MRKRRRYKLTVRDEDVYEYRLPLAHTLIALALCIVVIVLTLRLLS